MANDLALSEWARNKARILYELAQGVEPEAVVEKYSIDLPSLHRFQREFWIKGIAYFKSCGRGRPPTYIPEKAINQMVRLYLWSKSNPSDRWDKNTVIRAIRHLTGKTIGSSRAGRLLAFMQQLRQTPELTEQDLIDYYGGPFDADADQSA